MTDEQTPDKEPEDIYKKLNAFKPIVRIEKKHPCKDCFSCLFCGDARCSICLKKNCCQKKK